MAVNLDAYPWFDIANGDLIEQGDSLEDCPVFLPPTDIDLTTDRPVIANFKWEIRDLIILSQSCDLTKQREKVDDVLLCAVWKRSQMTTGHFSNDVGLEDARKGRLPAYHLLAECAIDGFRRELRIVDFRRVYPLPVAFVRRRASLSSRLRLMPPYREHLSQSFARFFMRVGLPIDIPPFVGSKGKK